MQQHTQQAHLIYRNVETQEFYSGTHCGFEPITGKNYQQLIAKRLLFSKSAITGYEIELLEGHMLCGIAQINQGILNTFSYDTRTGSKVITSSIARMITERYAEPSECGDTIICVVNPIRGELSFIKNGVHLGVAFSFNREIETILWISMQPFGKAILNLGWFPFSFNYNNVFPMITQNDYYQHIITTLTNIYPNPRQFENELTQIIQHQAFREIFFAIGVLKAIDSTTFYSPTNFSLLISKAKCNTAGCTFINIVLAMCFLCGKIIKRSQFRGQKATSEFEVSFQQWSINAQFPFLTKNACICVSVARQVLELAPQVCDHPLLCFLLSQMLLFEPSFSTAINNERTILLNKLIDIKSSIDDNSQTTVFQKLINYIVMPSHVNSPLLPLNVATVVMQRTLPNNYPRLIADCFLSINNSACFSKSSITSGITTEQTSTVIAFASALSLFSNAQIISELSSSILTPQQQWTFQLRVINQDTLTTDQVKGLTDIFPVSMIHRWLSVRVEQIGCSSPEMHTKNSVDRHTFITQLGASVNSLVEFCCVAGEVFAELATNGGAPEALSRTFVNLFKTFADLLKVQWLSQCAGFPRFVNQCLGLLASVDASMMCQEVLDRLLSLFELLFKTRIIDDDTLVPRAQTLRHVALILNALSILPQERTFSLLSSLAVVWRGFGFLDTRTKRNLKTYREAFACLAKQYCHLVRRLRQQSEEAQRHQKTPCPFQRETRGATQELPLCVCRVCHLRSFCGTKCVCGCTTLCKGCAALTSNDAETRMMPMVEFYPIGEKLVTYVDKVLAELASESKTKSSAEGSKVELFGHCYSLTLLEVFEVFSALVPTLFLNEGSLRRRLINTIFYFLLNRPCHPRAVAGIIANLHCSAVSLYSKTPLIEEVQSFSKMQSQNTLENTEPAYASNSFAAIFVESGLTNGRNTLDKLLDALRDIKTVLGIADGNIFSDFVNEVGLRLSASNEQNEPHRAAKRLKLSHAITPSPSIIQPIPFVLHSDYDNIIKKSQAEIDCAVEDYALCNDATKTPVSETPLVAPLCETQPSGQTCPVRMDLLCDYKLDCGHAFCHECLSSFDVTDKGTQEGKSVSCPLCKSVSVGIYSIRLLEKLRRGQAK